MEHGRPLPAAPAQLPAKGKQLVFGTPELRFGENLRIETVEKSFFTEETTRIKQKNNQEFQELNVKNESHERKTTE